MIVRNNNNKKVTLKDIADMTNLSVNTVSRVLKKRPYYSLEVEKKVIEAAKTLGYVGDSLASALRSGRSKTVAIVYDYFTNPFYAVMTDFIARRLAFSGYHSMIFSNYGKAAFLDFALFSQLLSRKVDGIISFLEPEESIVSFIKNSGVSFFVLGRDGSKYGFDSINLDNAEGGRLAAEHFLSLGHKEIAYIGSDKDLDVDNKRLSGFKQTILDHGLEFDEKNVVYLKDMGNINELYAYFMRNIKARAIFCFNDIFAFEFLERLHESGYSLPEDFALVGFDNIQSNLHLPKILTTIGTDLKQLSETAVEVLLLKMMNEKDEGKIFQKTQEVKLYKGYTT